MNSLLNIDISNIKTEDVINYINNFEWKTGETPFSSIYTPAIASVGYLVVVFGLQEYMKNRKEIKLHYLCLAHNLFLSLLSLVMFLGILIPLFSTNHGLYQLACQPITKGQVEFFFYIFYLSKVYEFLDTIFLVLRKKSLLPLHVYHHFITFWLCWVNLDQKTGIQWGDITANCFVHIIMYYYYYLCEKGQNPWWKKYITRIQITQFVFDIALHGLWHYFFHFGPCNGSMFGTQFSNFVIGSFLALFIHFYFKNYKSKSDAGANKKKTN